MYINSEKPFNWYGFNYTYNKQLADQVTRHFSQNLFDIKDIGGYSYNELSSAFNIKPWTLKRYIQGRQQDRIVRIPTNKIVFAYLFADFLRTHTPISYTKRKEKAERVRRYRQKLKENTTIKVIKGS